MTGAHVPHVSRALRRGQLLLSPNSRQLFRSATTIAPMGRSSSGASGRWASATLDHAVFAVAERVCRARDRHPKVQCLSQMEFRNALYLRRKLRDYVEYYNNDRKHIALAKDSPNPRAMKAEGRIVSRSILGGLHHRYSRESSK